MDGLVIYIHIYTHTLLCSAWRWLLKAETCRFEFLKMNKIVRLYLITLFNKSLLYYYRCSKCLPFCSIHLRHRWPSELTVASHKVLSSAFSNSGSLIVRVRSKSVRFCGKTLFCVMPTTKNRVVLDYLIWLGGWPFNSTTPSDPLCKMFNQEIPSLPPRSTTTDSGPLC
jgi:hypothetical protein